MVESNQYYVTRFYSFNQLKKFLDGQSPETLKIVSMSQENGEYTLIYYYEQVPVRTDYFDK